MKRLPIILSACLITSAIVTPLGAQAIFVENSQPGTLEDIINKLGDQTLSIYNTNVYTRSAYAFTESGKCYHYSECYCGSPVTVADGSELPVEEINQKLEQYKATIEYSSETGYVIKASVIQNRSAVYKVIQSYEQVKAIDEKYKVYTDTLWTCDGVVINSDKTNDEIISSYPELGLTYSEEETNEYNEYGSKYAEYECYKKYNDVRVFKLKTSLNQQSFNTEYYTSLKKLADNENMFLTDMIADMASSEETSSSTVNVYTASETDTDESDIMYGDIDNSNEVDLGDLTLLSMALLGDRDLDSTQKLKADVQYDDIIDVCDMAKLKQFIMHDKVKLGKPAPEKKDDQDPSKKEEDTPISNYLGHKESVSSDPEIEGTKFIALKTSTYTDELFKLPESERNVVIRSLSDFDKYNDMTKYNDLDVVRNSLALSDDFFKDNVIFMNLRYEPSCSFTNVISSASISDNKFTMNVDSYTPEVYNCAVAQWYLISVVPVKYLDDVDTSEFTTVFTTLNEFLFDKTYGMY